MISSIATMFNISSISVSVNYFSTTKVNLNVGKEDDKMSAKCDTAIATLSSLLSHFYSFLPPMTAVLLLTLVCLLYFYLYFCIFKNEKKAKEIILQVDQCDPEKNAFYMYKFIYRVGCPSALFDRDNAWVEFQLMKRKKLPFFEPIR